MVAVVVFVVVVEVPVIGVGAVMVDTVDVFAVELRTTPSDKRRYPYHLKGLPFGTRLIHVLFCVCVVLGALTPTPG